tara:strand:+ start:3401 stop:5200 length:1800 start_codon:yes stop_codon:yes gene_type:complete
MCGIFIVFSKKGNELPKNKCLNASYELYNRGPDFFKYSFLRKNTLYVSNTILSVTGKPDKKKSVVSSNNKNFYMSFNGEIYNYKQLRTSYISNVKLSSDFSDSEVLINLYENFDNKKIPKLLNGMFAYVIFNKIQDNLIIVNDVQGEKNLYYFEDNEVFVISSTIQAILNFKKEFKLNIHPIKNYFKTRHFMPDEYTCFKDIRIFKNGSLINYSLSNKKHKNLIYDNPYEWISENSFQQFQRMKEEDLVSFFDYELNKQAKIMVPNIKYGCIISGGIDSSLQAAIMNQYKDSDQNLVINHGKKDQIMKHINKFDFYFKKNIFKIKFNKEKYIKLASKCYNIISSPLQTHDLPARLEISNFFRKKKCKVFFSADGCDELFGGQQIYYNIFKKKFNYKLNISPYSSLLNLKNIFKYEKSHQYKNYLENSWSKSLSKYDFIKSQKEKNIQSSLFLDYFIQSINVANRSNDLISCSNSVEPRNIFISKNILKIILNLPLKYKLNYNEKKPYLRQKFLLKKIFCKYFDKKLIFAKEGFSGFPNALRNKNDTYSLTKKVLKIDKNLLLRNIKLYYDNKNLNRDIEWKLINCEKFFNNFLNKEIKY